MIKTSIPFKNSTSDTSVKIFPDKLGYMCKSTLFKNSESQNLDPKVAIDNKFSYHISVKVLVLKTQKVKIWTPKLRLINLVIIKRVIFYENMDFFF